MSELTRRNATRNMMPILEKDKETHDVGPFCFYPLRIYAHLIRNTKPKQGEGYRRGSRVQAHVCELELPFAVFPSSYCWSARSLVAITANTDIGASQSIQSQFTQIVTLHRRLPQIHTYDHIIVYESTELRFSYAFRWLQFCAYCKVFTDSGSFFAAHRLTRTQVSVPVTPPLNNKG